MIKILTAIAFFAPVTTAQAYTAVAGPDGEEYCYQFLALRTTAPGAIPGDHDANIAEAIAFAWAQGFMSGINTSRKDRIYVDLTAKSVHDQKIKIWTYCDTHSDEPYIKAALTLYQSLPARPTK